MAATTGIEGPDGRALLVQRIDGCLQSAIGAAGVSPAAFQRWSDRLAGPYAGLRAAQRDGSLPHLSIVEEEADIAAAEAAVARLAADARTIVFLGTGGSSLGGQTLAQLNGWNIPGAADASQKRRPRTRFYDNLDAATLGAMLSTIDLAATRFVVISKSGGTPETLTQAVAALAAVREAGYGNQIPRQFLAVSDPAAAGKTNHLRALAAAFAIPVLDHPPGIGGRFSCLSVVGLLPAIARGLDVRAVRRGAKAVVDRLAATDKATEFAPAVGALTAVALASECGIKVSVMLPYADRLARFAHWYVQLWAESLGKGGHGTTPIACLGPLDQHSQLQLFMDGPKEHLITVLRTPGAGVGPKLPADLARRAGIGFMADRTVGDLVAAQAEAVPAALAKAGRPVRTIDLDRLDEQSLGALMMHMMLETILAAGLLGVDAFDQPAVELAKVLTRERLASSR